MTVGFGNPYRFNTPSSTSISISNSANDACRKFWFSLASRRAVSVKSCCSFPTLMNSIDAGSGSNVAWERGSACGQMEKLSAEKFYFELSLCLHIIRSARASNLSGTSSPSALAAFRFDSSRKRLNLRIPYWSLCVFCQEKGTNCVVKAMDPCDYFLPIYQFLDALVEIVGVVMEHGSFILR